MVVVVFGVVFESPVKSGFLAQNGLTETLTGPSKSQNPKKPDWTT
jgi:hypothetical protein